jgi:hypothetical protein
MAYQVLDVQEDGWTRLYYCSPECLFRSSADMGAIYSGSRFDGDTRITTFSKVVDGYTFYAYWDEGVKTHFYTGKCLAPNCENVQG